MNLSNYPDNIRSFDHCPGSPFYSGPIMTDSEMLEVELDGILENEMDDLFGESITESPEFKAIVAAANLGKAKELLLLIQTARARYAQEVAIARVKNGACLWV